MATPKKMKKPLRGGKGTLARSGPAEKVRCRNHNEEMKYDPLIMGWRCPLNGCNYRRYKKSEVDQYGPPLICEGPFTLTLYKENTDPSIMPRVLLRGSNNVVVDLTSIATELGVDPSIQVNGHSLSPVVLGAQRTQYVLELTFAEFTMLTQPPLP